MVYRSGFGEFAGCGAQRSLLSNEILYLSVHNKIVYANQGQEEAHQRTVIIVNRKALPTRYQGSLICHTLVGKVEAL